MSVLTGSGEFTGQEGSSRLEWGGQSDSRKRCAAWAQPLAAGTSVAPCVPAGGSFARVLASLEST